VKKKHAQCARAPFLYVGGWLHPPATLPTPLISEAE